MILWRTLTDIIISVFCSSVFPLSSPLLPSLSFCALVLVIVTRSWPFSLYGKEYLQRWRVMRQVKYLLGRKMASLMAQMVKHLPAMQETQVWPLGQEGPLEKAMTMHSSTLSWKIPWMEEPGRLQPMGSQRVGRDWMTFHFHMCLDTQVELEQESRPHGGLNYFYGAFLLGFL